MVSGEPDLEDLMARASRGDGAAQQQLLVRYRDRLRRMVAARLDHRIAARVDPSDVVQEALLEATQRLPNYLRLRPVPFYPWLRRLAWEHLVKLHQCHLATQKRSTAREVSVAVGLSDDSVLVLAQHLVSPGSSPSHVLVRQELRGRVREALARLSEGDREVLVMRYLEQLAMSEIAAVLGINEGAVKMRHTRALQRLCKLLGDDLKEDPA
jgi:RNA polymerase sigma-70 factor (ECF subfamily)